MEQGEPPRKAALLEDLRASLDEDRKQAIETWAKTEKELSQALAVKQSSATQERTMRSSLPLQRRSAGSGWAGAAASVGGEARAGAGASSCSEDEARDAFARARRLHAARTGAFEERAKRMRRRTQETELQLAGHSKRKLRVKIASILREVRRRQGLQRQQEKARSFREARYSAGRGPMPYLGDATEWALGLAGAVGEAAQAAASPRRAALLDALTLEELDMLRHTTAFYFDDPSSSCSSSLSSSAPTLDTGESGASLDALVDFFTPNKEDKALPINVYARRLRARLKPKEEENPAYVPPPATPDGFIESLQVPPNHDPHERMPCQGRKPAVQDDTLSPTLSRVREVYNKRDIADAKWMEERQDTMVRRDALNAFKAAEQQRERQLEIFKQKELHKVRMMEAGERKAVLDGQLQERNEIQEFAKLERLRHAAEKAEDVVEDKRDKASATLDAWRQGVERSEWHLRRQERDTMDRAEAKWNRYSAQLWRLGMERHDKQESHGRKNDALKARIQGSLLAQLQEKQKAEGAALAEVIDAKQQAAAQRREKGVTAKYNFLEKAFGPQAPGFDAKYHWGTTDRRSKSWKKNAVDWHQERRSFSEPSLTATGTQDRAE